MLSLNTGKIIFIYCLLLVSIIAVIGGYSHGSKGRSVDIQANTKSTKAQNVILFIGDGMGISTVTAVRILEGQLNGGSGEEHVLSWERFPHVALSKTYNTNQQIPDSAGTATAMLTGVKTKAGVISVNQSVIRGDCQSAEGNALMTLIERAESVGMATGVVSTAALTHATPAAAYAHAADRKWQADADLPPEAIANNCRDIARQFVGFSFGDGVDVALGGGRENFSPEHVPDPEYPDKGGRRIDGHDLVSQWLHKHDNAAFVWNKKDFDLVDPSNVEKLLGLFDLNHMQFELDRAEDVGGEPSLSEMTAKAIDILSQRGKGYFLLVEAGLIDQAHHEGQAAYALHEGIALAEAVTVADKKTSDNDTLIIVTADHSHVFTLGGVPTRGNPILGKVILNDDSGVPKKDFDLALDNKPYTTLGYYNGPGSVGYDRPDLSDVDTSVKNFRQQAFIGLERETHGGEDVPIYAKGPNASSVHGVIEQNKIYHIIDQALQLSERFE